MRALSHCCSLPAFGGKAAEILRGGDDRFGSWKEALVAYNAGPDAVERARRAGINPDRYTTGGDYGRDVIERAAVIRNALPIPLPELIVSEDQPAQDWAVPLGLATLGVIGILLIQREIPVRKRGGLYFHTTSGA